MEKKEEIKKEIRSIDAELVRLLDRRMELCGERGGLLRETGRPVFDAAEQKASLEAVFNAAERFPEKGLERVFTEVLSQCLAAAGPLRVAYLGPPGTFSHHAAESVFGSAPDFVPCGSFDEIFTAAEKGDVNHSVVPIENSNGGVVHAVLDRFLDSNMTISSETIIYVHLCLIANCKLEDIEEIYSHPQPFLQCRQWLNRHLPKARRIEVSSTVEGVRRASESPGAAALGSSLAARLYGMKAVARNIQDNLENYTRFVILGKKPSPPTGEDKTSIILSLKHQPGSLSKALNPFAKRGINLSKIESRPTRQRPWEYVFFIDFGGHIEDEKIKEALDELRPHTIFIKFLGSYPKALTSEK